MSRGSDRVKLLCAKLYIELSKVLIELCVNGEMISLNEHLAIEAAINRARKLLDQVCGGDEHEVASQAQEE